MSEQTRIIELWKAENITQATFRFSCGGDCMGDTEWEFENDKSVIKNPNGELLSYFDNEVYNRVSFYVDSNGHYNGEAGIVKVTLIEEEGEEPHFQYYKNAESEYSESYQEIVQVELTPEQAKFIRNYVENINGGSDTSFTLNYKVDCLLSDEEEKIADGLKDYMGDYIDNVEPEGEYEGELDEWYEYNTDIDGEERVPQFAENKPNTLLVQKRYSTTVFKSDND